MRYGELETATLATPGPFEVNGPSVAGIPGIATAIAIDLRHGAASVSTSRR
jgi:hypothetical protein